MGHTGHVLFVCVSEECEDRERWDGEGVVSEDLSQINLDTSIVPREFLGVRFVKIS